jgi:hypothetical protein
MSGRDIADVSVLRDEHLTPSITFTNKYARQDYKLYLSCK